MKENWVTVLCNDAIAHGYNFPYGEIGFSLKPLVDSHGLESVRKAWLFWLENGPALGEKVSFMTARAFSRTFRYWAYLAAPADL